MKLATLCYVRDTVNNKTLMMHRIKKENDMHEGKWNGLGGKFEAGETPEECVIREVLEESGLLISHPRLQGFLTFPAFDGIEDWYVFVFTAESFTGTLIDSPEGVLAWIDTDKLSDLPLWEGDHLFLNWLNQPGFFSGKFVYESSGLTEHNVSFYV